MSCLVAIEHTDGVLVGCDSFQGGDWRDEVDRPKWFHLGEHLLVGYAGADKDTQVAEMALKRRPRHRGEEELKYLYRTVAEPIKAAHTAAGIKEMEETAFFAAYDGHVYLIDTNYVIYRSSRGFVAIGSGEATALGALVTVRKLQPDMPPKQQAVMALEAAVLLRAHVKEPFFFHDVPKVRRR